MPADEQDESRAPESPDEGAPLKFEQPPGGGPSPLAPLTPKGRRVGWRRVVNRRNAIWAGVVAAVAVVAIVLIALILYRTGQVDRIIARQIVDTLAKYNIRAEVGSFETKFGPRTVELRDLRLYNSVTGAPIGNIERILAKVRIEDMWALNLRRNVNLEELTVDRPEIWVTFDEQGRSNFSELKIPPPDPNSRILFAYSTAHARVNGAVVHYDDDRYDISGEARNVRAEARPEDPSAPEESRMNLIDLWLSDSSFVYNGRPVENISIEVHARANQVRADIRELVLRSPVTEARLSGTLDDWRDLRYRMQVNATVDLTQTSEVLRAGTTMRGVGRLEGTVTGEGDKYRVEGQVTSDALAADGVRLKALSVNATGSGQGSSYEAQGRAVAELLTAGDFQINMVQVAGGVTGTGTDFRWVGDLRAAAARSGASSIAALVLQDAAAELRDGRLSGAAKSLSAGSATFEGARVAGLQASGVEFAREEDGRARVTASGARAGTIVSGGTTVSGAEASQVEATINADESASVTVGRVTVGGVSAAGAKTGSINIAGVRLSVSPGGRVEGSSGDVAVGTVAFTAGGGGHAEQVRLARPRFTLEPGGRYRASADLSLGGGVVGKMPLGPARAAVVATGEQIQLNDFVAALGRGSARGNAVIATSPRASSSVATAFEGVDVGLLLAATTGNAVPLTGAATGTADLSFPGTNFRGASGRLDARFEGATGRDESARTPLTGELALTADRGLFQIERANLRTGATELNARGRFSFEGGSDLAVNLNSADAAELQSVVMATGLLPDLEERVKEFGVQLAGNLSFNGTLSGDLDDPLVNGRFELASLTMRGRDLGALSADVVSNASETRVTNGRLAQPGGGGAQFAAVIPRAGENNVSFEATLENADVSSLLLALGGDAPAEGEGGGMSAQSLAGLGRASGRVSVTGYPGAMAGSADLRVGSGVIGSQAYDEIVARATFSGSRVNVETVEARLAAGRVTASGNVDIEQKSFDFRAEGTGVRLDLLGGVLPAGRGAPRLGGIADFTASASGNILDPTSYRAEINARGRDVTINGQPAGELTLVGTTTADQKFNLELTTGLLGSPQVIRAQVDLAGEEGIPLIVETTLAGADLTPLFSALLPGSGVRVTGTATGSLRASGNLLDEEGGFTTSALSGRAEFTTLNVQIEDVALEAVSPLVVVFTPREITFEQTRFRGPGTNISFGGKAAIAAGGTNDVTVEGALNLGVLSNPGQNFFLSGAANVAVSVKGAYESPRLTGTASLANASFALLVSNQRLVASEINGLVRFNETNASIESLTGRLGGGRVSATGGVLLAGFRPVQFRVVARGDEVTVPFPADFRTTADAELEISGRLDSQIIKGTVNVRRSEYTENLDLADLIDQRREAPITEGGGGGGGGLLAGSVTTLDLIIQGRDALVVRNNLADMVGSISLRARGTVDDPLISGRITVTRGTLAFRNEQFELQRGIIDLPPRRDADPVLNIQAEADIRGYRVRAGITGPLSQPVTSLSSDPALPQTDVVSLITTGDLSGGSEGVSTLAQTGLGTATSLLTESLISAPVRKATDKLFGLNRFEFDPVIAGRGGASPTARLTVGRQVNRNLAVTFSTNVTGEPNQVVAVEYRVSDRLSFVAQYQQGSTDTLRARSNNFNFELRFRKRY